MQQQQEQAQVVAACSNSRLLHLVQNSRNVINEGRVSICYLFTAKVYFVMLEQFCQNIYPSTPWVILANDKGVSLLFPHMQAGLSGIFIPQGQECQQFLLSLNKLVQVIPFEQAIQISQFKTTITMHAKDVDINQLDNNTTAVGYIKSGGEQRIILFRALKEGFTWLGVKMAAGVTAAGTYINTKVDKKEEVEVSDETKVKYMGAKTVAAQTFNVTGAFLKDLFKPVVEKGSELKKDLNEKIDKSDNRNLKDGREITVATWDALGNALSGLGKALSTVGDEVGTNTRVIVEKRYGQDVSNTFMGQKEQKEAAKQY